MPPHGKPLNVPRSLFRFILVLLVACSTLAAAAQDLVIRNDADVAMAVHVWIWTAAPCPGAAYNDDFVLYVPANDQAVIVAPPEKFLLKAFIDCDQDQSVFEGETSCGGFTNSPFSCNAVEYAASQGERLLRIDEY